MPYMDKQETGRVYSIRDIADRLGLRYKTVWKWCRVDKTVKTIVYDSGTLRIPESELQRLLTQTAPASKENQP